MSDAARKGVLAGGSFIVDFVKIINDWPEQETLASISKETASNGGGPYNTLRDLAVLQPSLTLEACGLLGEDANGDWIIDDCRRHGIDGSQLQRTADAITSYTDAMTVSSTGKRTFFHHRGANALLGPEHFSFTKTNCKIFHLGYLMLLDRLDQIDKNRSCGAAEVIRAANEAGLITSVDCVSTPGPSFPQVVTAALHHVDFLFINEFESAQVLGRDVPAEREAMLAAARDLGKLGSARSTVVLHAANGAVALDKHGRSEAIGAAKLPKENIVGATGAGDAFAAGFLLGVHEDLGPANCLRYAVSSAAMSLSHATPSEGMKSLSECLALTEEFGLTSF